MKTYSVRAINKKDAEVFKYDGGELKILETFDWRKRLYAYLSIGSAWGFYSGEEAIALAGYFEVSPGVLQAWMLFNRDAKRYGKSICKDLRQIIDRAFKLGFHRMQTYAIKGSRSDSGYLELIGFIKEAELEAFTPTQENVYLYKMVKKCF